MKFFTLGFMLILLASACTPAEKQGSSTETPAQQVPDAKPVALPASFYKKLQGTIGNSAITMDLVRRDSVISGTYFYEKVGLPLSLSGSLSAAGVISMMEFEDQGDETGAFEGKFTDGHTFTGEWSNKAKHNALPFQLTEVMDGKPSITLEHFREENCAARDQRLKLAEQSDGTPTYDMCAYIDVSSIVVTMGNAAVDAAIAGEILRAQALDVSEEESAGKRIAPQSMADYLHTIQNLEFEEDLFRDQAIDIITNDRGILCLNAGGYDFNGGAHGIGWTHYLNLDLETGKLLLLKDLLVPKFADRLNAIAAKIFFDIPQNEEMLDDSEQSHFKLNDNFAITPGGLIFTFQPYEIGPYSAGMPEVRIPYTEMEDLIPAGGKLAHIRRK